MNNKIPFITKEIGTKTAVLYSVSQDCFHLETVKEYIESNIRVSFMQTQNDYRLIAIANNDTEGDAYIEVFRNHLEKAKSEKFSKTKS